LTQILKKLKTSENTESKDEKTANPTSENTLTTGAEKDNAEKKEAGIQQPHENTMQSMFDGIDGADDFSLFDMGGSVEPFGFGNGIGSGMFDFGLEMGLPVVSPVVQGQPMSHPAVIGGEVNESGLESPGKVLNLLEKSATPRNVNAVHTEYMTQSKNPDYVLNQSVDKYGNRAPSKRTSNIGVPETKGDSPAPKRMKTSE